MRLLLILLPILLLTGCVTEERLASLESIATRAQEIATRAQQGLASAEQAVAVAERALQTARTVAEATQSEQARRAVEAADAALAQAREALPVAQAAAETTARTATLAQSTVAEARAQLAAGASGWQAALGMVGTGLAGVLAAALPLLQALAKWRTAARLTAAHADRMEAADTLEEIEAAKRKAQTEQAVAGVAALIAQVRGKA